MERNQSSAPWLCPPNTLCNTDGRRRKRKSTRKITVRSAKKQERLKKHGTQNQSATGFDLETPSLPPLLTRDVTTRTGLCHLPGLSHLLTHLTLLSPPSHSHPLTSGVGVEAGLGGAERRVWRSLCWVRYQFSEGREHRQDVLVIIMAPVEMSVLQSLCCFTPSLHDNLIIIKMLLTCDSDGMFLKFFGEMRQDTRVKDVCGGRPVRTHYYPNTGTSTEVPHRYVQSNQATHRNTE